MDSKLTGNYKSIIFDLDGTLWDNTNTIADAWQRVLNQTSFTQHEVITR